MQNKLVFLLAALITAALFSGCAGEKDLPHESLYFRIDETQAYFDATVMDISESGAYLVAPFAVEDGKRVRSSDRILFGQSDLKSLPGIPHIEEGDAIRVVWGGLLMESFPMQIDDISALYLLDEDGAVIE